MQKSTVFSTVVTVSGAKVCRYCGRGFRYVTLGDSHALRCDAFEPGGGGLGPRLLEHSCSRTDAETKALRSTLGHAKMIVGKIQTCRYCGDETRTIYLFSTDAYWVVNNFGPDITPGAITTHQCDEHEAALAAGDK